MSFMQPFAEYGTWYVLDGDAGGLLVSVEVAGELPMDPDNPEYVVDENLWELADYYGGSNIVEARVVKGWAARLSAPGYLDCTDWIGVYDTEALALAELESVYGD